jgi:thiaminase (transcriptional activator TenA)
VNVAEPGLFDRLKAACPAAWQAYTAHEFVRLLGSGTLPEAAFRHYLAQDYLFLIHYARALGLAIYKADRLEDVRSALVILKAIVEVEMGLHVSYCARWGLDEAAMAAVPEDDATLAYTRFVLERGSAGDLLDLHVAMAPCVVGYAEIGQALAADPATKTNGNPYRDWIEMYAGAEYGEVAAQAVRQLDVLYARRAGPGRLPELERDFAAATRLEASFWQMGLNAAR